MNIIDVLGVVESIISDEPFYWTVIKILSHLALILYRYYKKHYTK